MKTSLSKRLGAGLLALLISQGAAYATLIHIGDVQMTGTGLGAVNSLVTFQNNDTEVGAVGLNSSGAFTTGASVAHGVDGFPAPGGATHEQTGSGNNVYTASALGLAPGGAMTFSNLVLIFNGNESGNAAAQAISLTDLSLNLYSTAGALLGSFSTDQTYDFTAFTGTGSAGFGFQLDAAQAASANSILSANPNLVIGGAARATGANAGPETVFVSTLAGTPPPVGVPESGTTIALLGLGMIGLAGFRRMTKR